MSPAQPLIHVQDCHRHFGAKKVTEGHSFDVARGETFEFLVAAAMVTVELFVFGAVAVRIAVHLFRYGSIGYCRKLSVHTAATRKP